MYHPLIISRNLDIVHSSGGVDGTPLPFQLTYYPESTIRSYTAHLEFLINRDLWRDRGKLEFKRPLAPDELEFIENERLLCTFDYLHFCQYAKILYWDGRGLDYYRPSKAQLIINDVRSSIEIKGVGIYIVQLKTRQVGACLHPDTLILREDLTWIRIDDLQVGEKLVAVDEFPIDKRRGVGRKLQTATVQARFEVQKPSYKIKLSNGQELIATGEHRFLCQLNYGNKNKHHSGSKWKEVNHLLPGDAIRCITQPWVSSSYEDGWMGGILDGEGSFRFKNRKGIELTITQTEGDVLDRMERYLQQNGYAYRKDVDAREAGTSSKLGSKPVVKLIIGRIGEIYRLLGQTRPSRFLKENWWIGKSLPGKQKASETAWATILSIDPLGEQRMVDLQTSESTYIANGLVSHNSTDDQVCLAHRVVFHSHTQALTASSKEDKTRELANKAGIVIRNLPWFLLPTLKKESGEEIADFKLYDSGEVYYESESLTTKIRLQHGKQTGGVGRGETPTFFHGTEIPDWDNPKEDIQNSLGKSMHNSPDVFFVAESTGKYEDDYWNELWKDSSQFYFQGLSRYYPLFLPWYAASDIYPTLADARAYMPEEFTPQEETQIMAEKAEKFVHNNDLLRKHMGGDWEMPLSQKWFYEWDKNQARREKRLATWLCEMPATDAEAFTVRGTGMFDAEFIQSWREKARLPEFVFGIDSPNADISFRHRFSHSEIDSDLTTIPVEAKWSSIALYHYSFTLYPLKPRDYSMNSLVGKLLIFELPNEDEEYEIGVDCAEGLGQDFTCFYILKKGDYLSGTKDMVVASFYSDWISASALLPFLLCAATFYCYTRNNKIEQPKLVIERPKGGAALIQEFIKLGWKNFYVNRSVAMREQKDPSQKLGWDPNQQQRDDLLSEFLRAIEDLEIECSCPFFIKCLATLGWNPNRRRIEAISGHHDDGIFAPGMAYFSIHSFDLKGRGETAEKRREQRKLRELQQRQGYIYSPGDMAKPVRGRNRLI